MLQPHALGEEGIINTTRLPALGLALALAAATPTSAAEPADAHAQLYVSEAIAGRPSVTAPAPYAPPPPCSDKAYKLSGGKWTTTLRWYFRGSSTPAGLVRSDVRAVIKRSYGNITKARNDCGRADRVSATASFLGKTTAKPSCKTRDGRNVVGFKALPSDVLARTCWWVSGSRIIEADVQINSNHSWATSLATCRFQPMLEAVVTHEVGHAFGLGHVSEKNHGRLTMSTRLDGLCNNQEASLGLGDILGLEALYRP
jgi:hypothetical protein